MALNEVKPEIRILGWDDASFDKGSEGEVPLVGSIVRGGKPYLEGVLFKEIEIDGKDATRKIIEASNQTKHKDQLRVIMLDGITFAGFNTVDIDKINKETDIPVLVIVRNEPELDKFKKAMENLPDSEERWKCVEKAGEFETMELERGTLFFQRSGISSDKAREVIEMSTENSTVPEPIRISHLIASASVRGESVARP